MKRHQIKQEMLQYLNNLLTFAFAFILIQVYFYNWQRMKTYHLKYIERRQRLVQAQFYFKI